MVKFGLAYDFRNPPQWHTPWEEFYRKTLDQVSYADTLGYDAIWLTEHHFIDDGYQPSLLPVAAAIAASTKNLLIGTSVLLLPLHNAIRIAEDSAVVDIISGGRFMLGISQAYRLEEFRAFGIPLTDRLSRFQEGIEVIKQAWTEPHVTFHGRHYQLDRVAVTPQPLQKPRPPIWIGATTIAGARRAAKLGDGFLGNTAAGSEMYREQLRQLNGPNASPNIARALVTYVSEDPDRDWHDLKHHFLYRHNLYTQWFGEAGLLSSLHAATGNLTDPDELRKINPNIIVDPEKCISLVEQHANEDGVSHIYFAATLPGADLDRTASSIELFAKRVIPHFRQQT